MRIRVYCAVDDHAGRKPKLALVDASNRYRVRVEHNGHEYELAIDSQNHLTLREPEGRPLIIQPRASNEVRINAEPWK